jgi:hypothetical protein
MDRVEGRRKQMSRFFVACSIAGLLAFGVTVAAQDPASPQTYPKTPAIASAQPQATVEGCLVREQDVPGRKPNVAEKAGVMEDYILTNAKVVKGSAPAGANPQARPAEPTGTSGTISAPMYDVKGIDDEQLKALVGKRVQVQGTFSDMDKSATAGPTEDLVDIRGTSIRRISGECPPK